MNDINPKNMVSELLAGLKRGGDLPLASDAIVSPGWDILHTLSRTARPRPIAYLSRETGNAQHILTHWASALVSAGLLVAVSSPAGFEYGLAAETRASIEGSD